MVRLVAERDHRDKSQRATNAHNAYSDKELRCGVISNGIKGHADESEECKRQVCLRFDSRLPGPTICPCFTIRANDMGHATDAKRRYAALVALQISTLSELSRKRTRELMAASAARHNVDGGEFGLSTLNMLTIGTNDARVAESQRHVGRSTRFFEGWLDRFPSYERTLYGRWYRRLRLAKKRASSRLSVIAEDQPIVSYIAPEARWFVGAGL